MDDNACFNIPNDGVNKQPVESAAPRTDADEAMAFLKALRPDGPWVLTAIIPDGKTDTRTFDSEPDARAYIEAQNRKPELVLHRQRLRSAQKEASQGRRHGRRLPAHRQRSARRRRLQRLLRSAFSQACRHTTRRRRSSLIAATACKGFGCWRRNSRFRGRRPVSKAMP